MAKLASQSISDNAEKYISSKSKEWSCPRAEVVRRILDGHIEKDSDKSLIEKRTEDEN